MMRILGFEISRQKAAVPAGTVPTRPSFWGWITEPFAGSWQKGVTVDPIGCLTSFGAVYACISRIANDIGKLEPQLKADRDDGTKELAPSASPFWVPLRKPNNFQNRIQFYVYWLICKLLYGNAYALKARDARGVVVALHLLDPRRVTPLVAPNGDVFYSLSGDDLGRIPTGTVVPAMEIIHDRMNTLWHPLVGIPPIYACGMAATQGIRIQRNSATFFENMSRPSGMLTAPNTIDDVTAKRLKDEFEANFSGGNIGRLAVLGDGLKYEAMTIPPEQAQLIEQLKWSVEDVARVFCMPAYKIGSGQMPTNNNVEALNQQYYSDCLQTHIEAIELCLDEGLELKAGYGVEFDLSGLLRMDQAAQMEMLAKSVESGVRAPNEARRVVNLPPLTGGDTVYLQQQMFSLEALSKRDAREDPFATAKPEPAAPALPAPVEEDESAAKFMDMITRGLDVEFA